MTVQLPTPGEDPWGDELNAAIIGLDTRVTAVESGGTTASRMVPLIIFNGESNSGGLAENAKATTYEISPRASVQIFDNAGLASFQDLDIGTNNLVGHAEFAPSEQTSRHGWELGLANSIEAGEWFDSTVYLVKTGQGGSTISQWNEAGSYWQTFLARVRPALSILRSQGLTPVIYVWYTLGINDAGAGTSIATWKTAVQDYFTRLREEVGYVPIFYTGFPTGSVGPTWTTAVNEIAAADNMVQVIDSTGAAVIQPPDFGSGAHWNYDGMKLMASRLGSASLNFGQHEGYNSRRIDMMATSQIVTPPAPSNVSLLCTPTSLSFTEGGSGGVLALTLDKAPTADVIITVGITGGNAVRSPATLTFTTTNWATAQNVTVTSANDGTASGNRSATVAFTSASITATVNVAVTIVDAGVGPTAPVNTALPAITGTAAVGSTLTCSQGTWTQTPTSYAYQWKRTGTNIAGATANTYVVVAGDADATLTCVVTATNAQGSGTATATGVLIPGAPWVALPAVTWTSLQNATTPTAGTLLWNGTAPGGGLVATAIDLTQAFEIELEMAAANDAAIMTLDTDNTAYYDWTSQVFLLCAYPYQGAMYVGTTMANPAPISGVTLSYPCRIKMAKSGNDVVFRYGQGTLPYGAVSQTLAGVLSGQTTAYIKGMYLGPGTTLKVNKA